MAICLLGKIVSIEVIILSTSSSLEIYGPHQVIILIDKNEKDIVPCHAFETSPGIKQ